MTDTLRKILAPTLFIVGILVVVVAFLAWTIFGSADTTTATDDGGSNVNITVESDEGASAPAANTDAAPAGDAAAPAPAESDAAPAAEGN